MDAFHEIKSAIDGYHAAVDGRLDALQGRLERVETSFARGYRGEPVSGGRDAATVPEIRAFTRFLRSGNEAELKALSVGSDPDGGYTVLPVLSERIVTRLKETSPMRSVAAITTVESDSLDVLVDDTEAAASWVAETAARTETTSPQLVQVSIPIHEIYAAPKATQKLLDDSSVNIEEWLTARVAEKFARTENTAFVTGDGVGKPKGFLDHTTSTADDDTRTWGEIQYVASGAAGAFTGTDPADALIDLAYKLNAGYRPGAVWMMNRSTARTVRQFKDAQSNYLWNAGLAGGEPDRLLGFPVILAEDMPAIAADSLSIAFGNFQAGYQIVDRHGMRVLRDPYSDKPHTVFYTYKRVGGAVVNFDAIKVMKFAAT